MKEIIAILACVLTVAAFGVGYGIYCQTYDNTVSVIARSGCCSHHGGVCGCSGARAVCCDGTLSPSCGCD